MELHITDKDPAEFRRPVPRTAKGRVKRILLEASSFNKLCKESLMVMANELKSKGCSKPTHYDCTMHICVNASDRKKLLIDFLSQVLILTYAHHTIFCSMYIKELTKKKLEAQLYGNWFDTFDNKVKRIAEQASTLKRNEDGLYTASLLLVS
jgi:SHS2 domain-containing protein